MSFWVSYVERGLRHSEGPWSKRKDAEVAAWTLSATKNVPTVIGEGPYEGLPPEGKVPQTGRCAALLVDETMARVLNGLLSVALGEGIDGLRFEFATPERYLHEIATARLEAFLKEFP